MNKPNQSPIQSKFIPVTKSARVHFSSPDQAEEIWIVLHGYGQLSSYFIQNFSSVNDRILVIAPEGLHRFYLEGFSGRVGASWMTREERLQDIKDYLNYLDQVYQSFVQPHQEKSLKIRLFGFSQGTATACRWLFHTQLHVDSVILWAGMFPPDIEISIDNHQKWKDAFLLYDPEDPFYNEVHYQNQLQWLKDQDLPYQELVYTGGHKITSEGLEQLCNKLR